MCNKENHNKTTLTIYGYFKEFTMKLCLHCFALLFPTQFSCVVININSHNIGRKGTQFIVSKTFAWRFIHFSQLAKITGVHYV